MKKTLRDNWRNQGEARKSGRKEIEGTCRTFAQTTTSESSLGANLEEPLGQGDTSRGLSMPGFSVKPPVITSGATEVTQLGV